MRTGPNSLADLKKKISLFFYQAVSLLYLCVKISKTWKLFCRNRRLWFISIVYKKWFWWRAKILYFCLGWVEILMTPLYLQTSLNPLLAAMRDIQVERLSECRTQRCGKWQNSQKHYPCFPSFAMISPHLIYFYSWFSMILKKCWFLSHF